jgi:hypothetical protein
LQVGLVAVKRPATPSLRAYAFLQSITRPRPSRPAAARQLLSWASAPYSTSGSGGPLAAGFTCPLRSAFRVWLPSWRFTPSEPVPVLFRTGGAHGIHPSELTSQKASTAFPPQIHPPTVFPVVVPNAEATGRPDRPRFLGVHPFGRPWPSDTGLACPKQDTPLGFAPPGFARVGLERAFTRSPPSCFSTRRRIAGGRTLEYRSASAWLHPTAAANCDNGRNDPRGVLAPVRS